MYSSSAYGPCGEVCAQAKTPDVSFSRQDTVSGVNDFRFWKYSLYRDAGWRRIRWNNRN